MTSKLDRRKKYTRMVLKESLIDLLKDKPISSITIKEICEEADINRSTYYSHYSDQYELLHQIEEEIIQDMTETLSQYNYNKDEEALQMTVKLLEYIAANKDICQILFSKHGDTTFQNRVMKIAHDYTVKSLLSLNNIDTETSLYLSIFAVSGSTHVIQSWLNNNMDKPPQEMAEIIINLTKKGLSSFQKL